ncbi:MAG: hypothetical protein AAFR90_12205 [Pseudomonadota bacterium]
MLFRPDKMRLVAFSRYAPANRVRKGRGKPETFNFLVSRLSAAGPAKGNSKSKEGPGGIVCGRSSRKSMEIGVGACSVTFPGRMPKSSGVAPLALLPCLRCCSVYLAVLSWRVGQYHVTRRISSTRHVMCQWLCALRWRSQKDAFSWIRMALRADEWAPRAESLIPWPDARFAVKSLEMGAVCMNLICTDLLRGKLASIVLSVKIRSH